MHISLEPYLGFPSVMLSGIITPAHCERGQNRGLEINSLLTVLHIHLYPEVTESTRFHDAVIGTEPSLCECCNDVLSGVVFFFFFLTCLYAIADSWKQLLP